MTSRSINQELEVLKEVCRKLEIAHLSYMITGSIAANFYAVPRMTRDIDIVIAVPKESVDRIVELFQDDFYIERESVSEAVETQGMFNLIHNDHVIKIDFIVRKDTPYRQLEFKRRRSVELENQKIWLVSPEDLILSKLFWAKDSLSEMQLGDVKNLLSAAKDLDVRYLNQWIDSLGLRDVYQRVSS